MLTKAVATGASVALGSVFGTPAGQQYSLAEAAFFAVLAVAALCFLVVHLRAAAPGVQGSEKQDVMAGVGSPYDSDGSRS